MRRRARLLYVGTDVTRDPARVRAQDRQAEAREAIAGLYELHAVAMIRLGVVMLGDRAAAEDVV